jgi:hypothetical protein
MNFSLIFFNLFKKDILYAICKAKEDQKSFLNLKILQSIFLFYKNFYF